jgi:hypothetical protein
MMLFDYCSKVPVIYYITDMKFTLIYIINTVCEAGSIQYILL